ncbi:ComEC/Rec2 family competence protein [Laspinema sp. D1]|uniref:ComEC/Rec2 family competence protein n=1 Tax=Laspinema palackyanum D2a TaxID=2953684 RepID=A0ABT2MZ59_9CYAN|nr:ComEC/Rec2 family competence protein [Laspinema sp. D2a]
MTSAPLVVLCLAYILGLLCTRFIWGGVVVLTLTGAIAAVLLLKVPFPKRLEVLKAGLKPRIWLIAGAIGFLATLYLPLRQPQIGVNDISRFVAASDAPSQQQLVNVFGRVASEPRLTRSNRIQFWFEPNQVIEIVGTSGRGGSDTAKTQTVTGKLYVTVPLLQGTGLYPGQRVEVTGRLYLPQPAANPGGFDFQAYLAREGTFAGLAGRQVNFPSSAGSPPTWGMWQLRRRILRAQVRGLGVPEGPVLSAMVLGRRAVDLPHDIRERFMQVGLAHVLAASGFHVAVILGLVRAVTRRFSEKAQFGYGAAVLIIYVFVTGGSPSVLRAALMGSAALLAPLMQRQVNALGSLLLAATFLLIWNPLWIWDLGFQMSFLATLGLLVSTPAVLKRLDWLPPAIASLIAVPIAVSVWVLPLQLYTFGVLAPYSIKLNILLSLPLAGITLGGFISAIAAAIWPLAGTAVAWLLYYPLKLTIAIVEFVSQLPGNSIATGTLSIVQLVILYGIVVSVWLIPWLHQKRRWVLGLLFAVGLVVVPVFYAQTTVFQITALATRGDPVLVVQDRGKAIVINSGDEATARYAVLPFLRQQGVNQIDWAIATTPVNYRSGWYQVFDSLRVRVFSSPETGPHQTGDRPLLTTLSNRKGSYHPLPVGQTLAVGTTGVQVVSLKPPVVQFQIRNQIWFLLGDLNPSQQSHLVTAGALLEGENGESPLRVLWWSGEQLAPYLVEALQPSVAIASSDAIDPETERLLRQRNTQIYAIGREGAIQWNSRDGFGSTLDPRENENLFL